MEKKDIRTVDVDEVLISLGSTGRYQMIQYVLATLSYFSEAYHGLAIVFIAKANQHLCSPQFSNLTPNSTNLRTNQTYFENNQTNMDYNQTNFEYGSCSIRYMNNATFEYNTSTCVHGYQYSQPKDSSIISDLDLVCSNAELADLSQTLLYLGGVIGAATLPIASDKFGRKPACILCNFCCLIFGIATSFSPDIITFLLLRLVIGIFIQGTSLPAVTLVSELFPTTKRKIVGAAGMVIWGTMVSSLAPLMYLVRMYSWRIVQLVLTVVSTYSLIQYWVMDESIRWLIANNKIDETEALIKKASKINRMDPRKTLQILYKAALVPEKSGDEDQEILLNGANNGAKISKTEIEKKMEYSMLDVFKSRHYGSSLLIVWFTLFTNSLVYFGILLTSSTLAGDMYLNFFLNCIVEIPMSIIIWFTIDRIGRKKLAIILHATAATSLLVSTFLRVYGEKDWTYTTATIFSLIGKMTITGSFNTMYYYTTEIFPTNIRNIAFGTCTTAARVGGMVAPFASLLAATIPWAPGAIFGICCFIVSGLICFLPESAGRELPRDMDQLKLFYTSSNPNQKYCTA